MSTALQCAIYYWNHAQWCRAHGFTYEAVLYEMDSWIYLLEDVSGVMP